MKNFKRIMVAMVAIVAMAMPSQAQFRWGIKAGVNVNSIHFSDQAIKDITDSENRAGFTGGLTAEFTVPLIGIGMDASLMYMHRVSDTKVAGTTTSTLDPVPDTKGDYIEIPINLKYKLGIPALGSLLTPYVFTGPSFAFLCSKKAVTAAYEQKSMDVAWNVGLGLQLFKHLQVGASYGFGITKALKYVNPLNINATENVGRNNSWTITAAYLF